MMRAILIITAAAACGHGESPGPIVIENEGILCATSTDPTFGVAPEQFFTANQPVFLQVIQDLCLSSSCTEQEMTSCTVGGAATALTISSRFSWVDTTSNNNGCTDDCLRLDAVCNTGPLPEGSYTINHGARQLALVIPSQTVTPPCTN